MPAEKRLRYLVCRGASRQPYYKRRVPPALQAALGGRSTFTVRLEGDPAGTSRDRQRFAASYTRADAAAEEALALASGSRRVLTAQEQLGAAGAWAATAGPQRTDPADRQEVVAVLQALEALELVLPSPIPPDWFPTGCSDAALVEATTRLAQRLDGLEHPEAVAPPGGELVQGEALQDPAAAAAFLAQAVQQAREGLAFWIGEACRQLAALGVVVEPGQQQAAAARLASVSAAMGKQAEQIEQGQIPQPLTFPPPPEPSIKTHTLGKALERWISLRSPAAKTISDTERRLAEFEAFIGTGDLAKLTPQLVVEWRGHLLDGGRTVATAKKHLGLVRAVLQAAAADGMAVSLPVLAQLEGKNIRSSSGTSRQRRPFTLAEAGLLVRVSRQQEGRPLDRWGLPLGLALGARIEELAGIRRQDVQQVGGQAVVAIQPSEQRRLKTDSSARLIPVPQHLVAEGFIEWAQQKPEGLLFPEPLPPDADPRLSHYATIRLGKIIRRAGITDPTATLHSARHFTAQQLVDAGAEQRVVEQIMGHGSRSMTARYSRAGLPIPLLAEAMEARDWSWWPAIQGGRQE
jgi:integrase